MTVRKDTIRSRPPRRNHDEQLKDEVYRQMFRLEEGRPGAELELAIALLRGWLAADCEPEVSKLREWLKKICPICCYDRSQTESEQLRSIVYPVSAALYLLRCELAESKAWVGEDEAAMEPSL